MSPADAEFILVVMERDHAKAILNLQFTSCSSQLQDLHLSTVLDKPVMLHHSGLTNPYSSNQSLFFLIFF